MKNGILLWLIGGTGVVLMYAAYKNINPLKVITDNTASQSTLSANAAREAAGKTASRAATVTASGSSYAGVSAEGSAYTNSPATKITKQGGR